MLKTLALPYGSIMGFVAPGAQMIRLVARGPLDVEDRDEIQWVRRLPRARTPITVIFGGVHF